MSTRRLTIPGKRCVSAEFHDLDPTAAIHLHCRECNDTDPVSGWVDCHADTCPLFEFRPGPWRTETPGAKHAARRATAATQHRGTLDTRARMPLIRAISTRGAPRAGLTAVSAPRGPQRMRRVAP